MATFKITYKQGDRPDETVGADDYVDQAEWITFRRISEGGATIDQVLRVRAAQVDRIERSD